MKKILVRLIVIAIVAAGGYGIWKGMSSLNTKTVSTPTTRVRKGDVIVRSYARGELRAVRSATLTAPNLFGTVQVTKLAPLGAFAREKDLIVEFDDSEVLARLETKQLELEQVDEQIKKAQADLAIRNNQDQVDLLRARYSVRRAELEVKRNELLSPIDQRKNILNLEEARRRLQQLESDIKSKQEQAQAELAVLRERRNRNLLDINRERMRLAQVKLLSPISGLVAIKQNRGSFSGNFGTAVPDIREGDQLQPGIPVADVLDLSELEVLARVGELDRANLTEGQEVMIRLDALPGQVFQGKIKSMSGTASANIFSSDPGKKFDVVFSVDMKQLLSALGAKPDQIARILATAEANRKKPIAQPSGGMFAMMGGGGFPGGGFPGGMAGGVGGGPMMVMQGGGGGMPGGMAGGGMAGGGMAGGGMAGGGMAGGGMMGSLTPEQQKKLQAEMQKLLKGRQIQDLSQEERREMFGKMREVMQSIRSTESAKPGDAKQADTKQAESRQAGGAAAGGERMARQGEGGRTRGEGAEGGTRQGGAEGGQRRSGFGGPGGMQMPGMSFGGGQFSQAEMDNAKLPAPPGEGSEFEALLRPGLLADVEIIVDKVSNAVYVPNQSVFEKDGKFVVYVQGPKGFTPRPIQIAKRSETVSIVQSGITDKDVIALADPTVKPGDAKKKAEGKASGGAASALPMGGSKGGQ
jgi:hypothetical protein